MLLLSRRHSTQLLMIPSILAGCSKLCIMCYVLVGQVLALFLCKNINLHILFTALKLRIRTKVYKGLPLRLLVHNE